MTPRKKGKPSPRKLRTVRWDSPVSRAVALMDRYRIRHLPVTGRNGEIVGIVSDRDLNRARDPRTAVKDFMTQPVHSVGRNMPLREAAQLMLDEKISALLVTGRTGRSEAMLTTDDLLARLISQLSRPTCFEELAFSPLVGETLGSSRS